MGNTSLLGSYGGQGNSSLMFRNRVINGAMVIDQRNAGAAVTFVGGGTGVQYPVDRFTVGVFGTTYSGNLFSAQRVSDAPAGFTNSLRITALQNVTFDSNKLGSFITHKIEGFNVADLDFGLSTARTVVLSFWVKSNKTGTVSVNLENNATDRSYGTTVTISQAATWEYKTVIISGDNAGTWLKDNGTGLVLNIGIASNGNWLVGAAGSWSATRAVFNSAQTNFLSATNDYIAITGVQLEAETATPFERRPIGVETQLAMRYFQRIDRRNVTPNGFVGVGPTIVPMRMAPACVIGEVRGLATGALLFSNVSAVGENELDLGYIDTATTSTVSCYNIRVDAEL